MCLATNIVRRGARYYVTARVPADLVKALGRKEIWKSLGTRANPKEAKRKAHPALAELQREFDAQREAHPEKTGNDPLSFTTDELRVIAREFYASELAADDRERISGASEGYAMLIRQPSAEALKVDLATGKSRYDLLRSGRDLHRSRLSGATAGRRGYWTATAVISVASAGRA